MHLEITFGGVTDSCAGWAKRLGISRQALHNRLKKYPAETAIFMGKKCGAERRQNGVSRLNLPKLDGLSEILHERAHEFSDILTDAERKRLDAIKARCC